MKGVGLFTIIVIVSLFNLQVSNQFKAKYYDIDLWIFFLGIKDKKFPLIRVHKFSTKFGYLDDDGGKLFAFECVQAKFIISLIWHCNYDPVMGNTFFFIIFFFYFIKISINYPTHLSKIPSKDNNHNLGILI